MSKYDIVRWDPVLTCNGLNMAPMIFISPDPAFLEFVKNNTCTVQVLIDDTDSLYDGKMIQGTVNKSSFMPNFFAQTNLYVISLECAWNGYLTNTGTAVFYGIYE